MIKKGSLSITTVFIAIIKRDIRATIYLRHEF